MKNVVVINAMELIKTRKIADVGETIPLGISLSFVLSFFESRLLSMYLLKAMAAVRAKIIQRITFRKRVTSKEYPSCAMPRKYPITANGIAKIV